jgi:Tol biopolymer transport system component
VVAEMAAAPGLTRKNLAWSPDGKWLAVFDRPQRQSGGIWLLSIETGARRRLTTLPEGEEARLEGGLAFAPDGRALAFIREIAGNDSDIYLQPLKSDLSTAGQPRRLTRDNQDKVGLAWAADGRSLIFSSGPPGNEELWRMPISEGARPIRLTVQNNEVLGLALSGRSNRLVFAQSRRELDIYRVDLDKTGGTVRGSLPLIVSSRYDRGPRYSPDGKKIAFASLRSGNWQLWASGSDGANLVQLTFFERGEVGLPEWSPDGQQIGFIAKTDGPGQAYVVNANGGEPRRLDVLGKVVRRWIWSRDRRWIFFFSARSGSPQIWRMPAPGGPPEQLTQQGFEGFESWFTQSPDGKLLYYLRPGGVSSVAVGGGEEQEVFETDPGSGIFNNALEATQSGIYFVGGGTTRKPGSLMFYRFSDKSISKVAGVESPSSYGLSLSPDGRHLLYTKFTGIGSDLMLVENFR